MINRLLILFLLLAPVFSWSQSDRNSVTVRVLDEDGATTAARVRFTDAEGQYYAPRGMNADFLVTSAQDPQSKEQGLMLDADRRFAYTNGNFEIDLPSTTIYVEVVKGFRYRIHRDTFVVSLESGQTLRVQLVPFADPALEDWYSGDVHVHYIDQETALLQMKCEDLNVCNVLISDFTVDHELFRGTIEPISEPDRIVYYGQEFREDRLGHINLLNLKSRLIEPAKEPRRFQYPLNIEAADQVHADGGHISWAHFAAWPGLEGPLGLILKKVDAVELLCTIDPFQPPIFASDVVPELPMNSGLRLYYRLLNCGLKIPVTAGTDKMNNQVSVGANRVYARVGDKLDYQQWVQAINAGQTFITNGPMIQCHIDQRGPGSEIATEAGKTHTIRAEVWSQFSIDRLEIICNGEMIAEHKMEAGEEYAVLEIPWQPQASSWITARAYQVARPYIRRGLSLAQRRDGGAHATPLNRYFGTLRPEMFFAHTSPIYLTIGNRPVYSKPDLEYFIRYLDNALEWLDQEGNFPDEAIKASVLQAFRRGRSAFSERLRE